MRRDKSALARTDGAKRRRHASLRRMDETPVISTLDGGVLTLRLNRPERLNAMSEALIEACIASSPAPATSRPSAACC